MSTVFRLLLPRQIYTALVEQARAELPNECCGLLAGRREGGSGRVERHYPLVNHLKSPELFESEPRSMLDADKDMRRRGLDVLAVYHSHPTSEPIPSRTDRERSFSPEVANLIISLQTSGPPIRAWWLTESSFCEAEMEIQDDS